MKTDLLTAAQISRELDVPASVVYRALADGQLVPDRVVAGRFFIFRRSRLPELLKQLVALQKQPSVMAVSQS